jgi:hypothetical protein
MKISEEKNTMLRNQLRRAFARFGRRAGQNGPRRKKAAKKRRAELGMVWGRKGLHSTKTELTGTSSNEASHKVVSVLQQ